MKAELNPFQELYVTDTPDPKVYVSLFSPYPVQHAQMLFRPGNVVIKGTQGTGKSMLLGLLRPRIRLTYHQVGEAFPVPRDLSRFISAGINLTTSGVLNIGQRPVMAGRLEEERESFPLYFGDSINYYITQDLLKSLSLMAYHGDAFENLVNPDRLDAFATKLARDDCWHGSLAGVGDFATLTERVNARVSAYHSFHSYNSCLAPDISTSKTEIGVPLSRAADRLREEEVIPEDVPVFLRIDQVERLHESDVFRAGLGIDYRGIINKALGSRDSRVSWRVGLRGHAWGQNLYIYGTGDQLENLRDFRIVDLDELLRRQEDSKTWVFPHFAEDVFVRRLLKAGYTKVPEDEAIRQVFGPRAKPQIEARAYVDARGPGEDRLGPRQILRIPDDWPPSWTGFLETLFQQDPYEAMLAAAWARQEGRRDKAPRLSKPPPRETRPWWKYYWRKERVRLCLLQLAARTAQRLRWFGEDQILGLSAGNISIFLSICHEIWESLLRVERGRGNSPRKDSSRIPKRIDPGVQATGIHTASVVWYNKIAEQPGGDDRKRLAYYLGKEIRQRLLEDVAMSNPGHNGFSLVDEETDQVPQLSSFLWEASAYGDLYDVRHTTKRQDRRQRTKWYLRPILSPLFQIPSIHTKEPIYVSPGQVVGWLYDANVRLPGLEVPIRIEPPSEKPKRKGRDDDSPTLFNQK